MDIENKMTSAGGKKLSIIALCIGGGSYVFSWIPLVNIAAAIVGLILAIKSSKMCKEEGVTTVFATLALVASIIGLVLGVIMTIVMICTCTLGCLGYSTGYSRYW